MMNVQSLSPEGCFHIHLLKGEIQDVCIEDDFGTSELV